MGSAEVVRRRVIVEGRVQGVFFRASLERVAREHGVSGSARNRDDGSVEAILEGPLDAVGEVVAFCSQGPEGADVSGVEVSAEQPEGLKGFETA